MAEDYSFTFKVHWDTHEALTGNKKKSQEKIRIAPGQPLNTMVFEEAIVLEENGVPTVEGLKERLNNHPYFIKEGEMKPIIDFINRL